LREINLNDLSYEEFEAALEILESQSIEFKIKIQIVSDSNNSNISENQIVSMLDQDTVSDLVLFWHQVFVDYYDSE
jgi:hypothetical protein